MATVYDIGDQPTVTATIRDIDGDLADPTAVTVDFIDPSGTQTDGGAATSSSTGIYTWTFPDALDDWGRWRVKFYATGTLVAAEEIIVLVRHSAFAA